MNNKTKIYTIGTLILSCAAMIYSSFMFLCRFESDKMLFQRGTAGAFTAFIILSVCAVVSGCFVIKPRRDRAHRMPERSPATMFFGAVTGFFAVAVFIFSILNGITSGTDTAARTVDYLVFASSLLCGAYFIYVSASVKPNKNAVSALGACALLFHIFRTVSLYFDMEYPMRNPVRVLGMITVISMMLYLCCEVRCLLACSKEKLYYISSFITVFFVCAFSLPMTVYSFASGSFTTYVIYYIMQISFGIYVICRLISFFNYEEETMRYVFAHYKKLEDVEWDKVERANVDKFGWGYEYKPETYAQGVWCSEGLCVKMTSYEKNPRATYTEFMDMVCNDACLEFFFSGDGIAYCNCECNPLGTQHTSCGAPGGRCSIDKVTDVPVITPEISEDKWSVLMVFSKKAFEDLTGLEMKKGTVFTGNFYKCGDMCEEVSYGMWNEVKTEKPSFHEPDYFGELVLG